MRENSVLDGRQPGERQYQGRFVILVTGIPASGKSVLAEQMMQCHKSFILENNFEASSKPELVRMLERDGYRALTLRLTGDYARIYERFVQRENSPQRHPGHVTNSRYSKEEGAASSQTITLEQYIAGIRAREMDSLCVGGPAITVDTTDFSAVDWKKLYQEIDNFCLSHRK